ncbi:MAG: OsmC family protein [bacterium]
MTTVSSKYLGSLRTEATHLQSGTTLTTDAPADNQGKGEYFSPTDLVATALGSCMVTIMGISARNYGFDLSGVTWKTTKMMTDSPRRIGEIIVELDFHGTPYTDQQKRVIEHITRTCPVALSLHPEVKQTVKITW